MSRTKTYTVNATAGGTSYSPCFVPDNWQTPFGVSMVISNVVGGAEATVQHTLSDFAATNLSNPANGTWLNHAFMVSGAVTQGNYAFPVNGIRLAVHANASASATITILQGMGC